MVMKILAEFLIMMKATMMILVAMAAMAAAASPDITIGQSQSGTCTYPNSCWPSNNVWNALNLTLGGSLVRARPPAYVCHVPFINEAACNIAKANWTNPFWRDQQPGGYHDPAWENGDSYCNIDNDPNVPCNQGLVPIYIAKVKNVMDVQVAVAFANVYKLSTRVKGASHDFLGRSSGNGTFGISTIQLKGINFNNNFKPKGASSSTQGQSVVQVAAGEHFIYVYREAEARGVVVVGGYGQSVGAAGGWILGGGHSLISPQYGLGVDNVLEFEVVTPDGILRTANKYLEKDLFWALRGGGPGFGVITKVTYKTYPKVQQIVSLPLNFTYTPASYPSFLKTFFRLQPALISNNITGYLFPSSTNFFTQTFVYNSADIAAANATIKPLYDWAEQENAAGRPVEIQNSFSVLSSYLGVWPIPPESPYEGLTEGTSLPVKYGSRLLPPSLFENEAKIDALVDIFVNRPMLTDIPQLPPVQWDLVAGGKVTQVSADATSVSPSWRNAAVHVVFVGAWLTDTPFSRRALIRQNVTDITQAVGAIVPGAGSYVNEADIDEPNWSQTFWGSNYNRLLSIKNNIDPKGIFTCYHCVGDRIRS